MDTGSEESFKSAGDVVTSISTVNSTPTVTQQGHENVSGRFKVIRIDEQSGHEASKLPSLLSSKIPSPTEGENAVKFIENANEQEKQKFEIEKSGVSIRFNNKQSKFGIEGSIEDTEGTTEKDDPTLLKNLYDYKGGTFELGRKEEMHTTTSAKLNTFFGVFLPCVQNIVGVVVFIRMYWIVGVAGVIQGLFLIGLCCLCTLLTSISMSAIATNGFVPAGGSYYMISRALGEKFGGSVGLLFYIGNGLAGGIYVLGACEILIKYICPAKCHFFGPPIENSKSAFNHYRIYGTVMLIILGVIVFLGIKIVSRIAPITLICVFLSISAILVGTFKSAISPPDLSICIIDIEPKHLLKSSVLKNNVKKYCIVNQTCTSEEDSDKNITMKNLTILCPLYKVLCHSNNLTSLQCNHLQHVKLINGIPGLKDNQLKNNLGSIYHIKGEVKNGVMGDSSIEVVATGVTSFLILVGIFFPSVTGIMAGSNRSGDLKDPSASIPLGTISAIITTSLIYFIIAILLGCTVQGILLRDKNGLSIDQQLVEAMVAWPSPYVILVGALCACFGAALQCLIGAPRLLQAVAKDGIIPMIEPFQTTYRGEPLYALFLTLGLSEFSILLGDFDVVTSLVSEFFLICYFTVNLACFLQTIVREPSWRPRFRCYHWILSLVGALLCLTIMFIASWYFALITCVLALFIYKYIEYTGATKEWGEGLRGLDYVAARVALQRLDNQRPTHTKNWRPQILAFIKCKYTTKHWSFSHEKFLDILSQLKAGKGLIMTASVLKGQFIEKREIGEQLQFYLKEQLLIHRIDGFIDVLITEQIFDGISHLIQTSGVGAFRPNTVAYGWPTSWSTWQNHEKGHDLIVKFLDTIRLAEEKKYAVILLKNIDAYPSLLEYQNGYIDIWWVIHDGGLLFLLAFLFQQHDVWKKCILRLFTVCNGKTQKPQEMKENLEKYVYQLRIHAQVNIIEMPDQEISAYTYQRTMKLEERQDLLQQLKLNMNDSKKLTPFDSQLLPDDEKHLTKSELEHKFPTVFKNYPSNDINLHYTYTPHNIQSEQDFKLKSPMEKYSPKKSSIMENAIVMKKMHSAVRLNEEMKKVSSNAVLVLINLPSLPKTTLSADYAFMEFCEALTDGLFRCMLVKGSGKELTVLLIITLNRYVMIIVKLV